jgi:hypothetical protein
MKNTRKFKNIEETKKDCGNCHDYSNPANYLRNFYNKLEMR